MARFTLPRDIYHGKGCLEELKNLKGKRAFLVVGGGSMKRQGFLDKAVSYLKEAGMEVELFEGVEPDPSVETVMKGAEAMRNFEPDWIVSMGGGSPIDAAKAMWAFYEYPETTFEDLCIPFNFPELRQKAKFCAIPSTSGTATEVTAFSVITNYQTGVKYPLADFNITPDVAIVDADLVMGLPVKQVAYTGMDALTHAIEAYVSTMNCSFTDPLALQAIEMVLPTTATWGRGSRCTTRSAWQEWHFPMRSLASYTRWHTRQALHSPQDISRTAVQMPSICLMSLNTMQKIRQRQNATRRFPAGWGLRGFLRKRSSTACVRRLTILM